MIIPPRDPKAIADAISELIDSPETLQAYGQAGYERVNSEFTMTAMTDNLEKHLQQKLREKSIQ